MTTPTILMTTCNGERYLDAQIDSLRTQSHPNWTLLVRDDASSDRTPTLLRRHAAADPRIRLITDDLGRLGAADNFARLMHEGLRNPAPAYAFCDQDDLWHRDKLAHQLDRLRQLQADSAGARPALVHCDLAPVDAAANPIGDSFMARQHIADPNDPPLTTLLMQNHIPGCSMLFNHALLELATPLPATAHMHDWWVALCAKATGDIAYLPAPLVHYRLHGGNQVGAGGIAGRLVRPLGWAAWLRKMNRIHQRSFAQAESLQRRLAERLAEPGPRPNDRQSASNATLADFVALTRRPRALRPFGLLSLRAHCQNPYLTGLFYLQSALRRLLPATTEAGQHPAAVSSALRSDDR